MPVYSDYAHHPTEIVSTLRSFHEKFPDRPVHVIFEPHQMARVIQFRDEFSQILAVQLNERRAMTPIYAARESLDLMKEIFPKDNSDQIAPEAIQSLYLAKSEDSLSQAFSQHI